MAIENRADKMLVIGAGPIGLAMANSLKQHGIIFDVVEAATDIGGIWYHGVYNTCHIISSRRVTQYSDYPMPTHFPEFPSAAQMLHYLCGYADHFRLRPHIECNKRIVMVRPSIAGKWQVSLENGEERLYKGVLVCTGRQLSRRFPTYPGQFSGTLLHSKDYKSRDQVAGKRVLVVGGGNSGCDIASDAAVVGHSSDLSLRRGYWFIPKTICGIPIHELLPVGSPLWLKRFVIELAVRFVVGDYRSYGLPKPNHHLFKDHTTLNSGMLEHLKHGRITLRPDIKHLDGQRVEFVDGSSADYDVVVFATGFGLDFPFFAKGFVAVVDDAPQVYGWMHPGYRHLYILGMTSARYGFGPLLTPAGNLLADIIKLQERMTLPIGSVLKAMGVKPPSSGYADPGAVLRQIRQARWLLPLLLPRVERILLRTKRYRPEFRLDQPDTDVQIS